MATTKTFSPSISTGGWDGIDHATAIDFSRKNEPDVIPIRQLMISTSTITEASLAGSKAAGIASAPWPLHRIDWIPCPYITFLAEPLDIVPVSLCVCG